LRQSISAMVIFDIFGDLSDVRYARTKAATKPTFRSRNASLDPVQAVYGTTLARSNAPNPHVCG